MVASSLNGSALDGDMLYAIAQGVFEYRRANPVERQTFAERRCPHPLDSRRGSGWIIGWRMMQGHEQPPQYIEQIVTEIAQAAMRVDESEPIDSIDRLIMYRNDDIDC